VPKVIILLLLITVLSSCGSLETKFAELQLGATRSDVARVMGPAPYKFTHEKVDAWRYAVIAGFGYCDYREFYIYRDSLIYKNVYHRASIAGCTAGLKDIDWKPVFAAVRDYDTKHPAENTESSSDDLVGQLQELNRMRESGALTEEEYQRAKEIILIQRD